MIDLRQSVPGLFAAVKAEEQLRDEAFIDAPTSICGIEAQQFTLDHFALLVAMRSPFLCGGDVTVNNIALFFWVVSPQYARAMRLQEALRPLSRCLARLAVLVMRCAFMRRLRHIKLCDASAGIRAYLDDALYDAPSGGGAGGEAYWSMFAALVASVAMETGWRERDIRSMPTRRAFQYHRIARKHRDPEAHIANKSGKLIVDWLKDECKTRSC